MTCGLRINWYSDDEGYQTKELQIDATNAEV